MNYMEQVAKMLGVEIGETFNIKREGKVLNSDFWINDAGLKCSGFECVEHVFINILNGKDKIKRKPFTPVSGQPYFIPEFSLDACCDNMHWTNDTYDKHYYERGMVFRTKEEAVEAAKKMLKALEG